MTDLKVWDNNIEDINYDKEHLLKEIYEMAENSQNAELLWRVAKAEIYLSFLSKLNDNKNGEKRMIYSAVEHSKRAVELNSSSLGAIKWYSASLGLVYPYETKRKQAQFCAIVKSELQKGVTIYPDDYHLRYIYGRWCYDIASRSSFEKKLVSMVTGVAINSTYIDALNMLTKANELRPKWKPIYLWIAKVYIKLKNDSEARNWLSDGLGLETKTEEDLLAHNHIIRVQKELSILKN